ncbi:hypothetical protein JXB28_03135 [Candidatus Woesearchaeota archaeon]|nr:hypothetical protein [Candidatus Woesearchaeota archaeon]
MAEGEFIFWCIIGVGFGITLFIKGFQSLRLKRFIETTPTSKVRSLAMGRVEICGEVVPAEKQILKSPLTGKDCVYYYYKVEELRRSNKRSYWAVIDTMKADVKFFLKDDTGAVLVEPNGASISIPADFNSQYSSFNAMPENIRTFLQSGNVKYKTLFGTTKTLRFTEFVIAPGDKLYILGYAGNNPFVEDGTAKDNVDGIMIQKGNLGKCYYIADKPEKDVLKKLKWGWIGGLFGGGALIVGGLAGIFIYFGVF